MVFHGWFIKNSTLSWHDLLGIPENNKFLYKDPVEVLGKYKGNESAREGEWKRQREK